MASGACPSREELVAYSNHALPPEVARAVAEHLAVCTVCQTGDTVTTSGLRRVGPYEILGRLGEGGMGEVFRARHVHLGREVALKLLQPERLQDASAVARFRREWRAVGRLRHINVATALDAGEADGLHYLAMELADGQDLARLLRRHGPLPIADACELARQAALGLAHAHAHGLAHRDVKPSNLMLTSEGLVKLLDLGLARLFDGERSPDDSLTVGGQFVGTPDYAAPEQVEHAASVDGRADLYALGCTLYALLTARPPFHGPEHTTPFRKLQAHVHEPPPPMRGIRGDVPAGVAALLARLLAKDPALRPTAADVAEALAPFARGHDVRRLLDEAPLPAQPLAAPTVDAAHPTGQRPSRPRRWLPAVTAVGVVVAVLVTVGMLAARREPALAPAGPARLEQLALTVGDDNRVTQHALIAAGRRLSAGPIVVRPQETFVLDGRFDQPGPWQLAWLDTRGKVTVVSGTGPAVRYPAEGSVGADAADPPGVHVLVLAGPGMVDEAAWPLLESVGPVAGEAPRPVARSPVVQRDRRVQTQADYERRIASALGVDSTSVQCVFVRVGGE